jgi:hypothetical protein
MIGAERIPLAMTKVFAVFSANKGDTMKVDQITCLGERQ